jgi:parallel beta-helix repeat protein
VYCENITIKNQKISHTSQAIQLEGSNNCKIIDNVLSENNYGMHLSPANYDNVIEGNIIKNNFYGIYGPTSRIKIEGNIISDNSYGIHLYVGWDNKILKNKISNNYYGLKLEFSALNEISYNNFLDNQRHVGFYVSSTDINNSWDSNYWGRPRIYSKLIFGRMRLGNSIINIPWFNFDYNPAKEPFDIEI